MENNNHYNKKGVFTVVYTLAAIFVILAFGVSILNSGNTPQQEINLEDNISPVDKSNVAPLTTETTTFEESTVETTTNKTSTLEENSSSSNNELTLFDDTKEMDWPVSGKIVMDYSKDSAIYDRTLEQYRTNDSICISANLGDEVKVATDGIITSITKDVVDGVTVSVDHGNGWCSTYSQLNEDLAVSEGEAVHKGDVIGTVGAPTKYSVALGPHLEFSVLNENNTTDPKLVLANE